MTSALSSTDGGGGGGVSSSSSSSHAVVDKLAVVWRSRGVSLNLSRDEQAV